MSREGGTYGANTYLVTIQQLVNKDMDYKDFLVIGIALLGGLAGSSLGPLGFIAGVLAGAGIGAMWASYSDRFEHMFFEENRD